MWVNVPLPCTSVTHKHILFVPYDVLGLRRKPQQDAARAGHPAEEPDQTSGVPEPLPDGSVRGRAVLRREELPGQADPGPEKTRGPRGGVESRGRQGGRVGGCQLPVGALACAWRR